MLPRLPISTLFPYTTLFRSGFDGDALIAGREQRFHQRSRVFDERDQIDGAGRKLSALDRGLEDLAHPRNVPSEQDRKSTRLNSSHSSISYAVFCLKKKKSIR